MEKISLWGLKIGGVLLSLGFVMGLFFSRESIEDIIRYTIFGSVLLCFVSFLILAITQRKKEGVFKKENLVGVPVKRKRGTKQIIMLIGVLLMSSFAISIPFAFILMAITKEGGHAWLPLVVGVPTFPLGTWATRAGTAASTTRRAP